MALTARCPHCAGEIKARDEAAGKSVKCPKCGGAFRFPAAAPPGPAGPVPARGLSEEDEPGDRPRGRRATNRDDDADDRPRRAAKKNKSYLGLILGLAGGLLVACGGGCAGLYVFLIRPAMEKADEIVRSSSRATIPEVVKPTEENAGKVRRGMTPAEVADLTGPGKLYTPTAEQPVAINVAQERQKDTIDRWAVKIQAGCVEVRSDGSTQLLVAYSKPPQDGGTVVGVVLTTDLFAAPASRELIAAPALPLPPENRSPRMLTIPETLLTSAPTLVGQYVQVSGRIERATESAGADEASIRLACDKGAVQCSFGAGQWAAGKYRPGDEVGIVGKVTQAAPKLVSLALCEVVSHTAPVGSERGAAMTAAALVGEFVKDSTAARAKYAGKVVKVSGTVKSVSGGTFVLTGGPDATDAKYVTQVSCVAAAGVPVGAVKVGVSVTLVGQVKDYSIHPPTRTKEVELVECKLEK